MTEPYPGRYRYLDSRRLRLVAASAELVEADLSGRKALAEKLGVRVPDNWPPELYDRQAMFFTLEQIAKRQPEGWSFWYIVHRQVSPETLIGVSGFKGRPDQNGSVELGYSVLGQFQGQGFATEAASRLVSWAFGHAVVRTVIAETFPHLKQSIRVLEKTGFVFRGPGSEQGVVQYGIDRNQLR